MPMSHFMAVHALNIWFLGLVNRLQNNIKYNNDKICRKFIKFSTIYTLTLHIDCIMQCRYWPLKDVIIVH